MTGGTGPRRDATPQLRIRLAAMDGESATAGASSCSWCGRPGHRVRYTIVDIRSGEIQCEDPCLCDVCAGLIGAAEGGEESDPYDAAVREVDRVLIDEYQSRRPSRPVA